MTTQPWNNTKARIAKARLAQEGVDEQLSLTLAEPEVVEHQRLIDVGVFDGVPARVLDVPESIPALGYGSHQYFRYYGKFPSIVGREIVSRFHERGSVLDCYNGSGTTVVEAQIAGHPSYGVDINPLAVLASNVKTAYYDPAMLSSALDAFLAGMKDDDPGWRPSKGAVWLDKWFSESVQVDLARLRHRLSEMEDHPAYEFLAVGFLGIVRRVSRAFDGEVRPHVNKDKRQRNAVEAFELKVLDNIGGLRDLDQRRPAGIQSRSIVADNRDADAYVGLVGEGRPGLIVAHPPYLNSFNYMPVYSLEFAWSEGVEAVWSCGLSLAEIRGLEQKAHPATDEQLVREYYRSISETIKAATACARPGAVLAVVVGDATIRGSLEPVHRKVWDGMLEQGLEPVEVWFRTTHYGIGKYAYSTRADYHGDAEKKDAILFVRVP